MWKICKRLALLLILFLLFKMYLFHSFIFVYFLNLYILFILLHSILFHFSFFLIVLLASSGHSFIFPLYPRNRLGIVVGKCSNQHGCHFLMGATNFPKISILMGCFWPFGKDKRQSSEEVGYTEELWCWWTS